MVCSYRWTDFIEMPNAKVITRIPQGKRCIGIAFIVGKYRVHIRDVEVISNRKNDEIRASCVDRVRCYSCRTSPFSCVGDEVKAYGCFLSCQEMNEALRRDNTEPQAAPSVNGLPSNIRDFIGPPGIDSLEGSIPFWPLLK